MYNEGHVYREVLPPAAAGETLPGYLAGRYPHSDAERWRERIAAGEVTLDGEPATVSSTLRPGQTLAWSRPPWQEPVAPAEVETLYEDDDLLAVVKPAGLPTLPGAGYMDNTLLAIVRGRVPAARPMHRLGRGTSGVVLFAKTDVAAREVQAQWRLPGAVHKLYRALVIGSPAEDTFTVETPIGRAPDPILADGLHCAMPDGKPARSHVVVALRRADSTLVDVTIETGRPHQIRIHLAAAGHPLVGDPLYGPGGTRRPGSTARPGDTGYHLHAFRLGLRHPVTGEALSFEAPYPEGY